MLKRFLQCQYENICHLPKATVVLVLVLAGVVGKTVELINVVVFIDSDVKEVSLKKKIVFVENNVKI